MEDQVIKKARARVKKKKGFYTHFAVFLSVGVFFFLMNMLTMGHNEELWFFFPMLPWGIGLAIHYFSVFGLPGTNILTEDWEAVELQKEIIRLKQEGYGDVTAEEKEEPEAKLTLKEMEKIKEKKWDDHDIV